MFASGGVGERVRAVHLLLIIDEAPGGVGESKGCEVAELGPLPQLHPQVSHEVCGNTPQLHLPGIPSVEAVLFGSRGNAVLCGEEA